MILFNKQEYTITCKGNSEDAAETISELLEMIGHLPDDYPISRIWRVTTLIEDMLPTRELLQHLAKILSQS